MKIKGSVVYEDLEGGFWGLIDEQGKQYLPVHMPEQLKSEGASVELVVKEVDVMSAHAWGTPVEILQFHTLPR